MSLPWSQIVHQRQTIASLGEVAAMAIGQRLGGGESAGATPALPSAEQTLVIPPRPKGLVGDYLRRVGGDPSSYRERVPPHMFPQWVFPAAGKTLRGVPYPLFKMLNGGCRLGINGPLPQGEPLTVRARLEGIDDNGRRAVLHQRVSTGPESAPEAVVAHIFEVIPLGASGGGRAGTRKKRDKPRVPREAREIAYLRLGSDAGLAFAMVTGDFNPVHWVRPYARAFGFRSTILHGFATMARAHEILNRALFAGDTERVRVLDVKFTRALSLPARVGVYVVEETRQVYVGDAPSGPAYLTGSFEARSGRD